MCDSLLGGRHDRVIGSDDDNRDIGNLSTTGTHSGKCLVTWGIKECNPTAVLKLHVISTDVLGNTTSLTSDNICLTDIVEERSLTMVNVTHHCNNRSTANEIILVILCLLNSLLYLSTYILGSKAKLLSHDVNRLCIQTLVDTYHHADRHQSSNKLCYRNIHHGSKLRNSNKLGELQGLLTQLLFHEFLITLLGSSITLFLTVLGTLLVLA